MVPTVPGAFLVPPKPGRDWAPGKGWPLLPNFVFFPFRAKPPGQEIANRARHPGPEMDPVRHVADRHFCGGPVTPYPTPNPARLFAMASRYSIHSPREPQRDNGHLEPIVVIRGAERHELVASDTQHVPERSCHVLDLRARKHVMPRRHRRVRSKHAAVADLVLRVGKSDTILEQLAEPFDVHERRM